MRARKVVMAIAAVAMLIPIIATAQYNVVDRNNNKNMVGGSQAGIYRPDSTARLLTTDGNGSLNVTEQYPAQQYQLIAPSILSTQFLRVAGASPSGTAVSDSCAPINVQGYSRLALLVYPMSGDSVLSVALALSWRLHASAVSDTQSTYTELAWNRQPLAAGGYIAPDTVGTLNSVTARLIRTSAGGVSVAGDDVTAMPGEVVVALNHTSAQTTQRLPRGRLIYLTNRDNQPISGNYISFYWRHLRTILVSTGQAAPAGNECRVKVRADLVGWR